MKKNLASWLCTLAITGLFLMFAGSCHKNDDNNGQVPTLTTDIESNVTPTSATTGGNITSQGSSSVIVRGVCWSTSQKPSVSGSHTTDGSGTGNYTSSITGLIPNTAYYVRAYATNNTGTAYGDQISFITLPFALGQSYGGGIIFYLDSTNQHGLIAASVDQTTISGAAWGCAGTSIPNTAAAIGKGQANTTAIMNGCVTPGIAARLCDQYSVTIGGFTFDDWFLPSTDELNQMYVKKTMIGGFSDDFYWSSTESVADYAIAQNFTNGNMASVGKASPHFVRALRAF